MFVLRIAALALEMHLYTYPSRYNRKSRWERRTNDNEHGREVAIFWKLASLKKKTKTKMKTMHERAGERWWWFVCLFFFFLSFCFLLATGTIFALRSGECRHARHVFYRQLPFFPLFLSVVYFNICTIYQELNATVSES